MGNELKAKGILRLRRYFPALSENKAGKIGFEIGFEVFEKIYQDGRTDALMELYEKFQKEVTGYGTDNEKDCRKFKKC
jgi:hypothetical protein